VQGKVCKLDIFEAHLTEKQTL